MNKLPFLQFAIVLIVGFSFWWNQTQINHLTKRCQRLEGETEDTSQECEKQTKLLKAALQEAGDWRVLHKAVVTERNRANAEILMLRPLMRVNEQERAKLMLENRQLRVVLEAGDVIRWPLIAAIPSRTLEAN
jgi:hypothetical protein